MYSSVCENTEQCREVRICIGAYAIQTVLGYILSESNLGILAYEG